MKLVKIRDGLIEQENFFTTSPSTEFLGNHEYTRTGDIFTLRKGYIERPFPYSEYVIEVEKENEPLEEGSFFDFYIRKEHIVSGMREQYGESDNGQVYKHWKLIRYDDYIQAYASVDKKSWVNKGGGEYIGKLSEVQGFKVSDNAELSIRDYKVYHSPYFTLYGLTPEFEVVLLNNGVETHRVIVDNTGSVNIFLDFVYENAVIEVYNTTGEQVFQSEPKVIKYGDIFLEAENNIELIYKGSILNHESTFLHTRKELIAIKNMSDSETYYDIGLSIINQNKDDVELSFDDSTYAESITLNELQPNEQRDFYIRITRDRTVGNYGLRNFALVID